jgi:acyl-CoA thioesterase FadM
MKPSAGASSFRIFLRSPLASRHVFIKRSRLELVLYIRAWVVGKRRKLFDAKAEVREGDANGTLFAEAEAVLYSVDPQSSAQQALATV